jgi:hypothetical protein
LRRGALRAAVRRVRLLARAGRRVFERFLASFFGLFALRFLLAMGSSVVGVRRIRDAAAQRRITAAW